MIESNLLAIDTTHVKLIAHLWLQHEHNLILLLRVF